MRTNEALPWSLALATEIVDGRKHDDGALLPILHALQNAFGYIDAEAIDLIADALNLSRAEVHGVVTFYHDFRSAPPARLVVKICRAEACQAVGGREAAQKLLDTLGLDWKQPSADGGIVVEPIYCLGLCAAAPAAMIGDHLIADFDAAALAAAVNEAR